ncbi:arylesterase [Sphingomonas sp. Root710]|uniref:alpha/beta hydrolase n=1 Tax=Sphingomonas sp. Root710 TaxID=1736594 RepID=UPI0006F22243|nr:alpha/beta hydrolase [Sphingomonas sp. Root710]KRB81073.1 arylesterase [Sphingomonas sp. Root710]
MTDASSTRRLIDPELLPLLETLPPFAMSAEALPAIRESLAEMILGRGVPPITPVKRVVDAPHGSIALFWYDPMPTAKDRPVLLHIHGGGMVMGSARHLPDGLSTLAARLGVVVASVEYRLAPETPFPGPQEDCYAALLWLAGKAAELGIDPKRIAIIGESAGGGLAAAVAQMARDRNGPELAAQILAYPMIDHRVGGEADPWRNRYTGEFIWTRENNQFGWEALRGSYGMNDDRKGWFSPSLAVDLTGLPPTWIGVGSLDLFIDENLDYARRLIDAGVPLELHVYPGAVHGFDLLGASRIASDFLCDMLSGTGRMLNCKKE